MGGGHVDNTIFPMYVAMARDQFIHETVEYDRPYGIPVVHLELDYFQELQAGDAISATVQLTEVGTTSFRTVTTLQRDTEDVAEALTVQVVTEPDSGEPVEIPSHWQRAFESV